MVTIIRCLGLITFAEFFMSVINNFLISRSSYFFQSKCEYVEESNSIHTFLKFTSAALLRKLH